MQYSFRKSCHRKFSILSSFIRRFQMVETAFAVQSCIFPEIARGIALKILIACVESIDQTTKSLRNIELSESDEVQHVVSRKNSQ